jgi:hypothetical protein
MPRISQTVRMRFAAIICLLVVVALAWEKPAQAQARGMSAIDIVEALVSSNSALRDRGSLELRIMSAETGQALGAEITRIGVREAEVALRRVAVGDSVPAAIAACCALDGKEDVVRFAALDALVAMAPKHVSDAGTKHLTPARLTVLRQVISESAYVKLQCEAAQEDAEGQLAPPVRAALGLAVLLDRFFGARGMPMLMRRVSEYMLGDDPANDGLKTAHCRWLEERLRRGASLWCEAIWIEAPAIKFNFSPISPYAERAKAVSRINRVLGEMEKQEVSYNEITFKGKRYGDVLSDLLSDTVQGIAIAAWLRLQWWSGDEVVIAGKGYAQAVDERSNLNARESRAAKSKLRKWWQEYRVQTEG